MAEVSLKLKKKNGSDYEITPLNGLNSVESKSQSTTQPKEIFYGVVPNTGSFEVTDYNGEIRKAIEADEIDYSNTQAELDFNGQVINSHITTDSDYNEDTVFSAEMTDTLANWDNINFAGRALTESCSLYVVLSDIVKSNLYQVYKRVTSVLAGKSSISDSTPFLKSSKKIFWSIETGELRENESLRLQVQLRKLPFTTKEIALTKENNPNNTDYPYRWVAITNEEFGDVLFSVYYDSTASDSHRLPICINVLRLDNLTTTDSTSVVFNSFFPLDNYLAKNVLASRICVLNGVSTEEMTIAEYLKGITVQYPYLPASTLREALTSVCEVAQLQIVGTHDNLWKFVSARPLMVATDAVLKIPPSMQFDRPQKDVILKNKYDGVELDAIEVKDSIDKNSVVYDYRQAVSTYEKEVDNTGKTATGGSSAHSLTIGGFIDVGYTTVTIDIPKKTKSNLEQILSLSKGFDNSGSSYISYTVNYKTEQANIVVKGSVLQRSSYPTPNYQFVNETTGNIPLNLVRTYSTPYPTATATLDYKKQDESNNTDENLVITETSTNYRLTLKLLTFAEHLAGTQYISTVSPTSTYVFPETLCNRYTATQLNVTFKGDKRVISFDLTKSASSANVASAKTVAKLNHNTLLQTGTTYKGTPIADIIRENVLDDYKNGISTATLNCTCDDVYTTKGTLALNFSEGNTLRVGDIVRLDKSHSGVSYYTKQDGSPQHFKVTGVTYGYDGYPYQNLELQALSNDVTHIYATKVDDHYEVGDGTNFALTSYNSIIPKEININDFIGGEVTKLNAKAFDNSSSYDYAPIDILVFDSNITLGNHSLIHIANKVVFNGNVATTGDTAAIMFYSGWIIVGEEPKTPIIEFGENVNIVGSPDGYLFGGNAYILGTANKGILVFKNTGAITLNIAKTTVAINLTIYADSSSVTTYDWTSKNITATIKPLSEYKE